MVNISIFFVELEHQIDLKTNFLVKKKTDQHYFCVW